MVVKKRDVSSLRDGEVAAVIQEYRAFVGWKTQDTTRKVGTGVTHCLLLGLLQWAWETWMYLLRLDYIGTELNETKATTLLSKL